MTKLQARFKDSITLAYKSTAVFMTVISCGNHGQTGDKWEHFCDLVEHSFKEGTIKKLIVIMTGGFNDIICH